MSTLDEYKKNAGNLGIIEKAILQSEDEDLKRLLSPPTMEGLINFFINGNYEEIKNEKSRKAVEVLANLFCVELGKKLIKEINQEYINCGDEGLSAFWEWRASYVNVKEFFYDSNEYKKTELRLKVRVLLDLLKLRISEVENIAINPILTKLLEGCPDWIKEFADRMGERSARAHKSVGVKNKETNKAKEILEEELLKIPKEDWSTKKKTTTNFIRDMTEKEGIKGVLEEGTIRNTVFKLKRKHNLSKPKK